MSSQPDVLSGLFSGRQLLRPEAGGPAAPTIVSVIETPSVRAILKHTGEPTNPPHVCAARGPPAWDDAPVEVDPGDASLAQPEPKMEFDQRIHW